MRKTIAIVAVTLGTILGGLTGVHAGAATTSPTPSGATIVHTALKYVGVPYSRFGTNPQTGFNDVGLVRYSYRQNGIRLHIHQSPTAYSQILADGPRVSMADLKAGDVVFFKNTVWSGLSHVGIYIGAGRFIHAEWYSTGVVVSSFKADSRDGEYWANHFLTANRPWAAG
jgi:cell wall-associated NlpC family hydrolase